MALRIRISKYTKCVVYFARIMRFIPRKYLKVLVLTILFGTILHLYQITDFGHHTCLVRPPVNLSGPISIISGPDLNDGSFQDFTKKLPLEVAYPKPGFHPFNSLAFKPPNQTDFREEEFTIIMLTHTRRKKMLSSLLNLVALRNVKKVILVWNDVEPPGEKFKLPRLDVPLQVVYSGNNSLNNRFRASSLVETEAVLSLDDDIYISHEDVLFAFSVWKQHRDQIVGFPGRDVNWNTTTTRWDYDSSSSPCSISLVLTGYAFLHRKYLSIYTQQMPELILDRIDNKTNCEDIAMNFLVSHITQKPPIKVTSRTNWQCPKCNENGLWKDSTHFGERQECVNFFVQIFGYIPLRTERMTYLKTILSASPVPVNAVNYYEY